MALNVMDKVFNEKNIIHVYNNNIYFNSISTIIFIYIHCIPRIYSSDIS